MSKDTREKEPKLIDPFAYLPSNRYATTNIFKEFESLESWKWLDNQIDEFFEKKFLPSLDKFDLIVTIDRKATTILKIKRKKYAELEEIDILKSSYVGDKKRYRGRRVAIFDDSIRTGKHSIDTIQIVSQSAASFRIFCIACLETGKENVKKSLRNVPADFGIEQQILYRKEKKFNDEFGKAICSYMLHLQVPSDKDHFYVECLIEKKEGFPEKMKVRSRDFIELLHKMGTVPFIVDTDEWNDDRLKISSHFENLDDIENIQSHLKFRRGITFKMRIFLRLDESILFLVPIPMDLIVWKSWKQRLGFSIRKKCSLNVRLCDYEEEETIDHDLKRHMCEECLHLNLKLGFLRYFLCKFDEVLSGKEFGMSISRTRWDKVEGNYPIKIHELVDAMVKDLDNISSKIEPNHDPALI